MADMEWRGIESAPKDGTRILVTRASPTGKPPTKIAWRYADSPAFDGWRHRQNGRLRYEPTHWMPLPAPPQDNSQ